MEALLFAGLIVLVVLVLDSRKTVNYLRSRIEDLEQRLEQLGDVMRPATSSEPVAEPAREVIATKRAAPVARATAPVSKPPETKPKTDKPGKPAAPKPSAAKRFEDLIGGKLPIWIGGIALVFAGFFLVRFSIEAGYFGPTMRCITAALFGLLLIGLAEFGKNIPRVGSVFTDDLRIGHSIAGAGIAVLYATLYMASELYGLLGLAPALIGVIAVTILAFFLSQKHGPPTAIMGLLGGFAAPYVAGLGPESVAPLLIYLGIFTAGLFGLAIHRGWAWLALLATGGSIIWTTALLFMDISGDIPFVGGFIVLLAIGGVLTLSRVDSSYGLPRVAMLAVPLVAGLLQLIMLAPLIEFSPMSWLFFGVLSAFSIALAWKDEELTPAVAGALGLALAMAALAFADFEPDRADLIPAIGFALLFGAAGHVFALRDKSGWMWSLIAMAAPVGMLLFGAMLADFAWSNTIWGIACLIVALTTALLAWRTRDRPATGTLPLASGLTAALLAIALWLWTADELAAVVAVAVGAGLAAWSRFTSGKSIAVEAAAAAGIAGLIMIVSGAGIISAVAASLTGETDLFSYLPDIGPMAIELLIPALGILATTWFYRETLGSRLAGGVAAIGLIAGSGFAYLLFKQPLGIGPAQQFVQYGFAERAVLTHLLALSGWLLVRRSWGENLTRPLKLLGFALAGLALFRFLYFDLFLLSPTSVRQALGPAPVANLGTVHFAGVALWLWLFARSEMVLHARASLVRPLEIGSLLAATVAVMVTVRQAVHGSDIATPPFTSTETYLYSAGLLILAIAWLARGIQTTNALQRIAGLLLLTIVTFKVFLVDAAQLDGVLRILSFLGLGVALIGIGWIYGKVMRAGETPAAAEE